MTDKEKITNTTARVILMLQQRAFTEAETDALIKCLQALLKHQVDKKANSND